MEKRFEEQLSAALVAANPILKEEAKEDLKFHFRLLADECLADSTVFHFLRKGFNIIRSPRGLSDKNVLEMATSTNRILVTHDFDFLDHEKYDPALIRGILVLPTKAKYHDALPQYSKAHDAALEYFTTKLPLIPCWWFSKLVVFRVRGDFDVQTLTEAPSYARLSCVKMIITALSS